MVLGTGHCPGLWAAHNSGPEIPLVFYRTFCNSAFEMPFRKVRELTWDDCLWSKGGCEPASARPGPDYLAFPDDSVACRLLPAIAMQPALASASRLPGETARSCCMLVTWSE